MTQACVPRRRLVRELVHIYDPEGAPRDEVKKGEQEARVDIMPVAKRYGMSLRLVAAHDLVPVTGAQPRLMLGAEDLLSPPRCITVSRSCANPAGARFLQAIYETVLDSDSVLLNDSISRSDALERDKVAIACHAAKTGIPVLPTLAIPFGRYAHGAMACVDRLGPGPWVLKPRELSSGQGVLKADTRQQLRAAIDIAAQTGNAYVIQPFVRNEGDLRVLMSGGRIFGATLRRPAENDYLANLSKGGRPESVPVPDDVAALCHRVSASLGARYLCIDWLLTADGPVLNEWTTALAGLCTAEQVEAFFEWISGEITKAEEFLPT